MNLSKESAVIVDCDITMKDQKRSVNHLYLVGKIRQLQILTGIISIMAVRM